MTFLILMNEKGGKINLFFRQAYHQKDYSTHRRFHPLYREYASLGGVAISHLPL